MYKILIVDDDLDFVEQLQHTFNSETHNFQIVDIEVLGIAAIGKFFTYKPDLLFLGENVYIMRGEELLYCIQKASHSYKVIYMIKNNDQTLEYPQVCAYLNKLELSWNKLEGILDDAIHELEKERRNSAEIAQRGNSAEKQADLATLLNQITVYQFNNLRRKNGLRIYDSNLVLAMFELPKDETLYRKLVDKFDSVFQEYGNGEQFRMEKLHCLLFNLPSGNIVYQNKVYETILEKFFKIIDDTLSSSGHLYVGSTTNVTMLYKEWSALLELRAYDYFVSDKRVIRISHMNVKESPELTRQVQELCQVIQQDAYIQDITGIKKHMQELFIGILKDSMNFRLLDLARNELQLLYELVSIVLLFGLDNRLPKRTFLTIEDEYGWYISQFLWLLSKIVQYKNRVRPCVFDAARIIFLGYQQDLPLDEVAHRVGMSTSRFSTLFKQDMGVGYTAFVNHVRINKAKSLLLTGKTARESAQMVGYSDAKYFSRVFKSIVGITPKAFRIREMNAED